MTVSLKNKESLYSANLSLQNNYNFQIYTYIKLSNKMKKQDVSFNLN